MLCTNSCGEMVHKVQLQRHKETDCTHEQVNCDLCDQVSVRRHQLTHHKNESCFARLTCTRCHIDYARSATHSQEDCINVLANRCAVLQKECKTQAETIKKLRRKLEGKVDKKFVHLLVNDPQAARAEINKQMGGIRLGDKSKLALEALSMIDT